MEFGQLQIRKHTLIFTTNTFVALEQRLPNYLQISIHPSSVWSAWPKSGLTTRASTTVSFLVFRADRVSAEKTCGGGIWIADQTVELTWNGLRYVFRLKYFLFFPSQYILQSVRGHFAIALTVTINGMQEIRPVISSSFSTLSDDRFKSSSKTIPPHSAI
jgi:hypothetical protein